MKIVIGDKKLENAQAIAKIMNDVGFDAVPVEMDLSSRDSIMNLISEAQKYGETSMLVNARGFHPVRLPETDFESGLYGTAVLLEEIGKVIKEGGVGVTISSQSGWCMPCPDSRGRRIAGNYADGGTAKSLSAAAREYPGYPARLPDGETL